MGRLCGNKLWHERDTCAALVLHVKVNLHVRVSFHPILSGAGRFREAHRRAWWESHDEDLRGSVLCHLHARYVDHWNWGKENEDARTPCTVEFLCKTHGALA